jgi:hypothetical protein
MTLNLPTLQLQAIAAVTGYAPVDTSQEGGERAQPAAGNVIHHAPAVPVLAVAPA